MRTSVVRSRRDRALETWFSGVGLFSYLNSVELIDTIVMLSSTLEIRSVEFLLRSVSATDRGSRAV